MSRLAVEFSIAYASLRSSIFLGLTLLAAIAFSQVNTAILDNHLFTILRNRKNSHSQLYFSLKLVKMDRAENKLPIGCHLVTPRRCYMHHGIYLGESEVIHYSGIRRSLKPGPIEVTDLQGFADGKPLWIVQEPCHYSSSEIVHRARSRIGERQYKILSNNCEHFCNWCISGKSYSAQVNACLHSPRYLLALILALKPYFIA